MKKQIKKYLPILLFATLLTGSYSYVYHQEFHTPITGTEVTNNQADESTYQLPDIQFLKLIIGLVQKLRPTL